MNQIATDVLKPVGNVTIQISNKEKIIKEFTKHNNITPEGIANLLRTLTLNRSSYISGIGIVYHDPEDALSLDKEEIYTDFSSIKIVNGVQPYAEFRYYLSSDKLNGMTLIGANLKTRDNVGTLVTFATVRTTDELEDSTPVITVGEIEKTEALSVLYIWRISFTSEFVQIIY